MTASGSCAHTMLSETKSEVRNKIFIESQGFCVMAGVGKDNGTVDGNIVSSDKEVC